MRVVLSWLLALAVVGRAHADALKDALARLQDRYDQTTTLVSTFTQTIESQAIAGGLTASGTVAFEKPNRMRWDFAPPDEQTIVGDGETLWIYQPDLQQVIKAPLAQAFQAKTPVTFLQGLGRVDRDFDASLERDEKERWALKLVPKGDPGIGTLYLTVRKKDGSIDEVKITDQLGTTTKIRFANEERNVAIKPERFTFKPPPGVDVVAPPSY